MRVVRYKVATPGYKVLLNQYHWPYKHTIGICAVMGQHAYSFVWRKAKVK